MRVYHLLETKWALNKIVHQRLKVAGFGDLNDPFELVAGELSERGLRRRFSQWLRTVRENYGVVCFSRSWRNPVLWSHYGDKHRGVCLGFDVPDALLRRVSYVKKRLRIVENDLRRGEPADSLRDRMFGTKFEHWQYEEEERLVVPLKDVAHDGPHSFLHFGNHLRLKEVVAGPLCGIGRDELVALFGDHAQDATFTKARLAFRTFSVVTDRRGFPERESTTIARARTAPETQTVEKL